MNILLIASSCDFFPMYAAPLGEVCLATYLQKKGYEVEILDLALSTDYKKDIEHKINSFNPNVIGMSIRNIDIACYPNTLYFYPFARNAIQYTKEITDVPIILGGSGFSIFAEEILRDIPHDIGIFGEGEISFAELIKKIERGEDPRSLPKGVCYIDNNGNYVQKEPWRVEDMDTLPFPNRELIQNDKYKLVDGRVIGNLQTKRGCPYNCIFCSYKYLEGPKMRYRSPAKVVEELDVLVNNFDVSNVFFVDSLFNVDKNHVKQIAETIIKKKIDLKWGANYRCDGRFIELLPLLKNSGCEHLAIGLESLSDEVLNSIKKYTFAQDSIETIKCLTELQIEEFIQVLFGGPGETISTVKRTLDALAELPLNAGTWEGASAILLMTGIRIYPHTEIQKIAESDGVITKGENLLLPKFYITPEIQEQELFDVIESYCIGRDTWNFPGINMNCPQEMTDFMMKQLEMYGVNY